MSYSEDDLWDDDFYVDEDGWDEDHNGVDEDNSRGKKKRNNNKQRKGKELDTLMHVSSEKPTVYEMDGLDPVANVGRSVRKQQLITIKKNAVDFVEPIDLHAASLN